MADSSRELPLRAPHAGASDCTLADRVLALQRTAGNAAVVQLMRTPASAAIEPLLETGLFDWEVSEDDERAILRHLSRDPDVSQTIADLDAAGRLGDLFSGVDEARYRRRMLRLLGSRANAVARRKLEPHVARLPHDWQIIYRLATHGVTTGASPFTPTAAQAALIGGPTDPFSGQGATGVNATSLSIPRGDQAMMVYEREAGTAGAAGSVTSRYTNPIPGSLPGYLAGLTPGQRADQARIFLRRPISTNVSTYGGATPSRAQIVVAAASAHRLEPAMLAGFLLAEQRDQSRNEDAKDYGAATSLLSADTSIGLGQVVISTARRGDLFADLLTSGTRSGLSHDEIARDLASDELNIFAAARYIRRTATAGAGKTAASLPNTVLQYPGVDFPRFARHSSTWPPDNIKVLGSEYTSRPWDDNLSPWWGDFVYEAVLDCRASGALP